MLIWQANSTMTAAILQAIQFASLLTISYCGHDELASYRFNVQLSDSYSIYWAFDIETKYIQFAIRVQTTGWVGLGLSPNGQMPRSDVVIGWVNKDGTVFFHVSSNNNYVYIACMCIYTQSWKCAGYHVTLSFLVRALSFLPSIIQDRYAFGRFTPEIDEEQNWFLISGKEENGTTILQFWRKFTSCDDHDMDVTVIVYK